MLQTKRRTATVTAASDVTVLEMFGADLAVLNAQVPSVHAAIERAMAERMPASPSEQGAQYASRMSTTNTSVSVPAMPVCEFPPEP